MSLGTSVALLGIGATAGTIIYCTCCRSRSEANPTDPNHPSDAPKYQMHDIICCVFICCKGNAVGDQPGHSKATDNENINVKSDQPPSYEVATRVIQPCPTKQTSTEVSMMSSASTTKSNRPHPCDQNDKPANIDSHNTDSVSKSLEKEEPLPSSSIWC